MQIGNWLLARNFEFEKNSTVSPLFWLVWQNAKLKLWKRFAKIPHKIIIMKQPYDNWLGNLHLTFYCMLQTYNNQVNICPSIKPDQVKNEELLIKCRDIWGRSMLPSYYSISFQWVCQEWQISEQCYVY